MKEKDKGNIGISLAGPTPDSIKEAAKAIEAILSAPHADEKTKRAAIEVISRLTPNNVTISNSQFEL